MDRTRQIITPMLSPSLAEFKAHIRMTFDDMDADLLLKLKAAVLAAENFIGEVIAMSTFTYSDTFSASVILPNAPLYAVDVVKVDGVVKASSLYTISGQTLTFSDEVTGSAVEIFYRAGYKSVPDDMKAGILLHAAHLFENPVDSVETLPKASTNLLRPYRLWNADRH